MTISPNARTVFRNYVMDGVPSSGAHKIEKAAERTWGTAVETAIDAYSSGAGSIAKATRALLFADLAHAADVMAWVYADSTVAYNGIYRKSGGTGTGSWTRILDLPYQFVVGTDAGAGTANAIQVTTEIPVSDGMIVAFGLFEATTSSPATVSFNGGAALTIKTNRGNNASALSADMDLWGRVRSDDSSFVLLNDQDVSALVAQAEAALAEFRAIYLGAFAVAPTVDLVGNPLIVGAEYFNTVDGVKYTWDGSAWVQASDLSVYVPTYLATAIPAAPPINKANGYRWSIFAFSGGETERSKATAVADYQETINVALATGEKVEFPKWEYPVRSLSGDHGVETAGVDIDVECAAGATIIAGDVFWNAAHNVLQLVGDVPVTADSLGGAATLKWRGGVISGRQLTTDHGTGTGFGNGLMNVVGFRQPSVRHVFFDGGVVTPTLNLIGAGAMDTGCGWNQNVGGDFSFNTVLGFYDLGVYVIGYRLVSTLAANPVTSGTAGSAVVTVTATAHGMRNGDRCHLKGITTFDGLTFADTEYAVSGVTTDTFQVSATSGTATVGAVAGGGSSVIFTNSRSNKRSESILGESTTFQGNFFTRNTNALGFKRNTRNNKVIGNTLRENATGIATSGVGEYEGGDGKGLLIAHNDIALTMNWPILLLGGGRDTLVAENTIENWGRQLYDGWATAVNLSSGFPLSGIRVSSMDTATLRGNKLSMTDVFAGATWITGEEPAAIRLDRNTDYISGCVDCVVGDNTVVDVPQPYNDSADNLRTVFESTNKVRGATKNSVYGSPGVSISSKKIIASANMALDATGSVAATIAHGLDYTPSVGNCVPCMGQTSTNAHNISGPRVVASDATNVTVQFNNGTALAGHWIQVNVRIE